MSPCPARSKPRPAAHSPPWHPVFEPGPSRRRRQRYRRPPAWRHSMRQHDVGHHAVEARDRAGKDHDVVHDKSQHEQDGRDHGHLDRCLGAFLAQACTNDHYDPPPNAPASVATSTVIGMEPPPGSEISAMVNTASLIVRSTWYCRASQSALGSVTPSGIFRRLS